MIKYEPSKIEQKWQQQWESAGICSPDLVRAAKPFYNLMMFPYPSAEGLHVGNMYAFCGSDIYGRFKRMQGYDVFEPIGLDGFGIHSENYALKVGRHPREQAKISEKNFYRQLRATGNAYDWTRKLETYDPNYYKWTQWIFIQLFKKGLAYRAKAHVNFCPQDKTVLADEQVIDGRCERCGTVVEKRELEQWFFRITKYADRLLDNIEKLDWSERVKIAQRQWIGKKVGIDITYKIGGSDKEVACFTTRPDTNFGATFIVIGPEHPMIYKITQKRYLDAVKKYAQAAARKSDRERIEEGRKKTGVFAGSYAVNNLNGKKLPIWVSDFVLGNVGTGAVVGVPGHDKRDFEFAQTMRLPVIRVVVGSDGDKSPITNIDQVQEGEGTMINSQFLDGMDIQAATKVIMDYLEKKSWGKKVTTYHLRDWLISRQRYWGSPIPMIYCKNCAGGQGKGKEASLGKGKEVGQDKTINLTSKPNRPPNRNLTTIIDGEKYAVIPVPEDQLPVLLPDVKDWKPNTSAKSLSVKGPLANHPEFYKVACPECGSEARRETDVSDTFLDSAWYFLRYLATDRDDVPFPSEAFIKNSKYEARNPKQKQFRISNFDIRAFARRARWLPVDMYIGGAEHSVLHLLYTRFLSMVFYDLGLVGFEEPFAKFRAHGLLISAGAKMSKSKGNVVVPDAYIEKYGADTLRCYLMFCGRFVQGGDFRDTGMEGMHRFLKRVWRLAEQVDWQSGSQVVRQSGRKNPDDQITRDPDSLHIMHQTIKKVTGDIEELSYNTAISALMIWLNALEARTTDKKPLTTDKSTVKGQVSIVELETFLKLLAPFAPHVTEELWQMLKGQGKEASLGKGEVGGQQQTNDLTSKPNRHHNPNLTTFGSIHSQPWPEYDPKLAVAKQITLVVQVNGKVRDKLLVEAGIGQKEAEKLAVSREKVQKFLGGKVARKVIYVPDKLLNFVV